METIGYENSMTGKVMYWDVTGTLDTCIAMAKREVTTPHCKGFVTTEHQSATITLRHNGTHAIDYS